MSAARVLSTSRSCVAMYTALTPLRFQFFRASCGCRVKDVPPNAQSVSRNTTPAAPAVTRSEEHTSELQSPYDLVCRLLLEKKKKTTKNVYTRSKKDYK